MINRDPNIVSLCRPQKVADERRPRSHTTKGRAVTTLDDITGRGGRDRETMMDDEESRRGSHTSVLVSSGLSADREMQQNNRVGGLFESSISSSAFDLRLRVEFQSLPASRESAQAASLIPPLRAAVRLS